MVNGAQWRQVPPRLFRSLPRFAFGAGPHGEAMLHFDRKTLKNLDAVLLFSVVCLAVLGCLAVRSATHDDPQLIGCAGKQVLWATIGVIALMLASLVDWQAFERLGGWIYGANIALLCAVFIPGVGTSAGGAQRWINLGFIQLQPSEISKAAVSVALAVWLLDHQEHVHEFPTVIRSLLYIAPPMLLVLIQPDLGTALVFFALWLGIVFAAGARMRHIVSVLGGCVLLFSLAWAMGFVRDYQKERLTAFLNPDLSPLDAGYHVIQSQIAIGSGRLWGKGFHRWTPVIMLSSLRLPLDRVGSGGRGCSTELRTS